MIAIKNAELIMHDHMIPDAVLFVEDGKIKGFGEARLMPIPAGCEVIDAEGAYVAPGMVDIHTHSGNGKYFYEDVKKVSRHFLDHGTTTVLAALYYDMNCEKYLEAIKTVTDAMLTPDCPNLCGIYMEGPYLNPKFGCNREKNPWKGPIDQKDYDRLIAACGDAVYVWGCAPERENIEAFVKAAKAAKPSVRFSVAHSEATPEQIEALMPYGLCIGTHHTNATGTLPAPPECRSVCVDETVNYHHDIYAEIICDSRGIHVHPYMQRLVRRIKGDDRIILISDAFAADGPTPPGYEGVTDINFDYAGEIAGSNLTLEVACRNMMRHTGASLVDVFNYASYNPARAIGMLDRGEIAVGKRADLVFVDCKVNVKKVMLGGVMQ